MVSIDFSNEQLEWLRDLVYQQQQIYERNIMDTRFIFTEAERWKISERINQLYSKINKALEKEQVH